MPPTHKSGPMENSDIPDDHREILRIIADDRYRLRAELGQGGMATVFVADDVELDRLVAIKILHRHLLRKQEHRARFRREAESIAGLDHPGLLEVHDLLIEPGRFQAIVMEYIPGPSLAELIDDGPLICPELAVEAVLPILDALDHAHHRGIIHRDLKPANILIGDDARPRLTDFGVAHVLDKKTLTETGSVMGSPAFMSPEGIKGEPIDARTDIFSMGSILYLMVTGKPAFSGRAPTTLMRHIAQGKHQRADFTREAVGRPFADLLERLLSTDPDGRPSSAAEVADLLRDFLDESVGDDRPDLRRWVDAPATYPEQLRDRVAGRLEERAGAAIDAGDRRKAIAIVERLGALRPQDTDVASLLDGLESDDNGNGARADRSHLFAAVGLFIGVLAISAGVVAYIFVDTADETVQKPGAQPVDSTPPEEEAISGAVEGATDAIGEALWKSHITHHSAVSGQRVAESARGLAAAIDTDTDAAVASSPTDPVDPLPPDQAGSPQAVEEADQQQQAAPSHQVSFQLVPPSAVLQIGDDEFDAIDASRGVELPPGEHAFVADGQGVEPRRETLAVNEDTPEHRSVVLDWKDGYIRIGVDRDALVWIDDRDSPQSITAGEPRRFAISFGPADEVDNRRDVIIRVAPRDNLQHSRQRTVEVRPDTESPVDISFNGN